MLLNPGGGDGSAAGGIRGRGIGRTRLRPSPARSEMLKRRTLLRMTSPEFRPPASGRGWAIQVARHGAAAAEVGERGVVRAADRHRLRAARMEAAARRRPLRARHLAGDDHARARAPRPPGRRPASPPSAPWYRGASACGRARRALAISTMRPRYITAMRLLTWRTTARSCAMKGRSSPSRSCSSWNRLTTCAWIDTSSAETGSSQIEQPRLERERARDADALALAAGELVRVAVGHVGQQADHARAARRPARVARPCRAAVDLQRLADDVARPSCAGRASRTDPGRPSACAGGSAACAPGRGG